MCPSIKYNEREFVSFSDLDCIKGPLSDALHEIAISSGNSNKPFELMVSLNVLAGFIENGMISEYFLDTIAVYNEGNLFFVSIPISYQGELSYLSLGTNSQKSGLFYSFDKLSYEDPNGSAIEVVSKSFQKFMEHEGDTNNRKRLVLTDPQRHIMKQVFGGERLAYGFSEAKKADISFSKRY